jgi:hypothetical protein
MNSNYALPYKFILLALITISTSCYSCRDKSVQNNDSNKEYHTTGGSPSKENVIANSRLKLILLVDQYSLSNNAMLSQLKETLIKSCLSGNKMRITNVEMYGLGTGFSSNTNLLSDCSINDKQCDLIRRGSWKAKNEVKSRWTDNLAKVDVSNGRGAKIIESLSILNESLTGSTTNDDVRVVYITDWLEIADETDRDKEMYCVIESNPDRGIYKLDKAAIEGMFSDFDNEESMMRIMAGQLKNTIQSKGLNLKKIYYFSPGHYPVDKDNLYFKLNSFWDKLFLKANLSRVKLGNLNELL